MNKITPLEFVKNITTYTEAERREIVAAMSKEELNELSSLLELVNTAYASAKPNVGTYEYRGKVYEEDEGDAEVREFAKVTRRQSDSFQVWDFHLKRLKKYDDPSIRGSLMNVSEKITVSYMESIKEVLKEDSTYNRAGSRLYTLSKLWIMLFQNLQNVKQDYLLDTMAAGLNAYADPEFEISHKRISKDITLISEGFRGLNYLIRDIQNRRSHLDVSNLNTRADIASRMLLLNQILRKNLIYIKDAWNRNYNLIVGSHPEHWYDTTAMNMFKKAFDEIYTDLINEINTEIDELKREVNEYRNNGISVDIVIPQICSIMIPDVYHVAPVAVNKFLTEPESMPNNITQSELYFYKSCIGSNWTEDKIIKAFMLQ